MATSLKEFHEDLTSGDFGVFRAHVKVGNTKSSLDALNSGTLTYRAEWDTSNNEEIRRRRTELENELDIPNKVRWNGSTYTFKLRTKNARDAITRGRWFKIYDRGYIEGYSLQSLEWAATLANADGSIEVHGQEYDFDGLFWNQTTSKEKCPICQNSIPDTHRDEKGGLVSNDGVLGKEDFNICLSCALTAIGEHS